MSRRFGILIFCVVLAHLSLLFMDFSKQSPPPPKHSLIVNTYSLPKPQPPPPKPRPKQKPYPGRVKKASEKQKILSELSKTLAKIESMQTKVEHSPLLLPKSIDSLQVDREDANYFSILAVFLKEALELPEVGSVKLELTLFKDGRVQQVRVLTSESEKNKHYLEKQIKFLRFPPFTEGLKKERKHTFVLTFCNEK